jgi:NitT/TauT family transport system ATP-binding protein
LVDITLHQVSVSYPVRKGHILALEGVSSEIRAGTFVALVGPSGCGKTTLLRAVGGLIAPTTGQIRVGRLTPDQARRKRVISFLFQRPVLLPWKTARQNVELPLSLAGKPRQQRRNLANQVLERVGLCEFAEAYPHQLSGGMQQRVSLARAFASEPAAFLMDEPFSALDELNRERLNHEMLRIWSTTRATVLFVTHSLFEAVFLADRVLVLSGHPGRLLADLSIHLPRPRTTKTFEHPELLRQVTTLRQKLAAGIVAGEEQ